MEMKSKTFRFYLVLLFIFFLYFIIYTSLMLLSIIPSSIGDIFGRSLLISYLTLFPLFMDIFIRVLVLKIKGSTISNFSRIILGYSLITQLLYVYNLIQPIDFLTIFFSRGVFYLVFFFLVILLLKMLINYSQIREMLPIHTLFLAVLALFPLFFGYIFPIGKEVSFIYSIPLLLLILFSIVNNLILERLIYVAWKWNPFIYNLIFAVFFTSLIILFSLLLREFSPIFFVLYTFLFSLALLPEIRKMMLISHKMEGIFSSFHTFVATELEREEIATFIHDTTIQKVIYYKKQLEISEQINRGALLEMLDDIVFELRDLCSNIYPLMVHELGLKESITSILNQFMKMETVSIMTTFSIDEEKVNDKVDTFVLRIVKELINNSILHGNAREITVDLSTKEKILSIEVTDDGIFKGNYQSNEHHFGLNRFLNTVPKIVLLSGFYDTLLHKRAMDFGIQAFLPKESSYLDVKSAIYAVYKGNHVIPDGLLEKQENNLLTDTELSVLELIVKEYSNEKIANSLFVSRRTVDTHVSNICSKLGVTSRVGAVREAIRLNLVSL